MSSDDAKRQEAEIEAIAAIYGEDFAVDWLPQCGEGPPVRCVSLRLVDAGVTLRAKLPAHYPSAAAPELSLVPTTSAAGASKQQLAAVCEALRARLVPGEEALFSCAQAAAEELSALLSQPAAAVVAPVAPAPVPLPRIVAGEAVTDRKSRFQAHAAVVHSVAEADAVFAALLEDKRIAEATHNIRAYKIAHGRDAAQVDEQRFDDGETGAGDKLLFLLDSRGEFEVVVVVSRWYGGIHLGPDRFKHITNVARAVLECPQFQQLRTAPPSKKQQ